MDKLEQYRQIIKTVLRQYVDIDYANVDADNQAVFDTETDQYIIVSYGWGNNGWGDNRRIHGCLIHVNIINGKVWVQRDDTQEGVTNELMAAGIPKEEIVLGFHAPKLRKYTDFAIA